MRGRTQPLTVVIPVRRPWALWLRLSWPPAERLPGLSGFVKGPLFRLRFIAFAHFTLVRRVPRRGGARVPAPFILFHTNFNGDAEPYIDAFALRVAGRIRMMAAGAHGWPGTGHRGRFRDWFTARIADAPHHFHSAYPDASVKEVQSALALREAFGDELQGAGGDDPAAFATRWQRFLDRHAEDL